MNHNEEIRSHEGQACYRSLFLILPLSATPEISRFVASQTRAFNQGFELLHLSEGTTRSTGMARELPLRPGERRHPYRERNDESGKRQPHPGALSRHGPASVMADSVGAT